MKNIHVLPTDKPSSILYNFTLKSFCVQNEKNGMYINDGKVAGADFWTIEKAIGNAFIPVNIYITSDEEFENCWFVNLTNGKIGYIKNNIGIQKNAKKIILTTDQDLIKDGVQSIDDEFLEWFIKNQSCEEVEVKPLLSNNGRAFFGYKIIIPKEEPCTCTDECLGYLTKTCKRIEEPKQHVELINKNIDQFDESLNKFKQKQLLTNMMREDDKLGLYDEPKEESIEDIELEEVRVSSYCQFSVIENKLAILYRNQVKILKAIKMLNNGNK